MNALVLFSGEDVRSDGKVIVVAVDELEREHSALSRQHSAKNALSYASRVIASEGG